MKIEIYEPPMCCSTGILYNDLIHFLDNSDTEDYIDIKFVDLITDVVDGHSTMKYFIQKGFGFPITTSNGEIKLYGGISNNIIYQEIKRLLYYERSYPTLDKTV